MPLPLVPVISTAGEALRSLDEEGIHHSHHNCRGIARANRQEADALLADDSGYEIAIPLAKQGAVVVTGSIANKLFRAFNDRLVAPFSFQEQSRSLIRGASQPLSAFLPSAFCFFGMQAPVGAQGVKAMVAP